MQDKEKGAKMTIEDHRALKKKLDDMKKQKEKEKEKEKTKEKEQDAKQ